MLHASVWGTLPYTSLHTFSDLWNVEGHLYETSTTYRSTAPSMEPLITLIPNPETLIPKP